MAVLSDFAMILGDKPKTIEVTTGSSEAPLPEFKSGGREANHPVLLMCSVQHMSGTAKVFINNLEVGMINPSSGALWSTQLIAGSGSTLRDQQKNEIFLKDVTDRFVIKTVVCFFHRSD